MESSKQHKDHPNDNLLSQRLHPSSRSNQPLEEDRTDIEQTTSDKAEHHFCEAAFSMTSSAHLLDETEPFLTPFPVDSSNLTYSDDLLPFSTSPWFLLQQCSPIPSQQAAFTTLCHDLALTTPTAFPPLLDPFSNSDHNPFASLDDETPSSLKPTPKNPTTSENEKNIVAEALLGLHAQQGIHADNDVLEERNANQLSSKPSCKCKSSQCLKLYCSCFRAGVHCTERLCECTNCHNIVTPELSPSNHPKNCTCSTCSAVVTQKMQQVGQNASETSQGCNCKSSSHCLKLYCGCFRSGNLCNPDRCKCVGCKNTAKENCGIRRKAVESCLKRRLDAFDARPRKGNGASCSCKKTL